MIKKGYCQYFRPAYKVEFPSVKESSKGNTHAFCDVCKCDFVISHGGRSDIVKHVKSKKHESNANNCSQNRKVSSFFQIDSEVNVTRAECLFTHFLIEHNIPLSAADHAAPLFRKMFPDSELVKNYSCARTKTSAIINEMADFHQKDLIKLLQNSAFSLAVDGSNDSDNKLYPIVVTYFSDSIKSAMLCLANLNGDSTGENISKLIIDHLDKFNIPISNCIAFSADNAPVMLGHKKGVACFLKKHQKELIVMGCPCHLINLAAEKASAALPVNIDKILIDVFYYLEKSAKRKENLKKFQQLHGEETRKILKHVCTRWLSLGKALGRLMEQWDPLVSFFHAEVKSGKVKWNEEPSSKRMKLSEEISKKCIVSISVQERIFYFLSSDLNKTYCSFLLYTVPLFEETNIQLQSVSPKIQVLKRILEELLKGILTKFVKPAVIKKFKDLTEIPFDNLENQKNDEDLFLGNTTFELVKKLNHADKKEFFEAVRKYFETACNYIIKKFPLKSEILLHAQVANVKEIDNHTFNSIRYFVEKFPFLLTVKDGETTDLAMNELQKQFTDLQCEELVQREETIDVLVDVIGKMCRADRIFKYDRIATVLKAILTVPHSNSECERVFSTVKKNKTQFRSSISTKTLENFLLVKSLSENNCHNTEYPNSFLVNAKKCTVNYLTKK